ncbi:MAG TPA: hypothetical protein VEA37_12645 [Flavobacterium sp.]|nr:hypothetical protein [Flavobacterium sp.]
MSEIIDKKPKMYLSAVLRRLNCSRTHFYTHYADRLTKEKDASGYRNIYITDEVEALVKEIQLDAIEK